MRSCVQKFFIGTAALTCQVAISAGIHGLTLMGSALIWTVIYLLIAQSEYGRYADPTGEYEVVLTYPKLYTFIPAMPGQGGDKSGTVTIYDQDGNYHGSHAIDFVRDGYSIEWTETGASLEFVGEWDFEAGTYSYWSDNGDYVVKQAR